MSWVARNPRKTIVAATIVLFFVLDFVVAHLLPRRDAKIRTPDPHYHHGLVANSATEESWGSRSYPVFVNSLGFRDSRVREIPLRSAKYRVVFMGDSFTEGRGVTWEESFAGIIARELSDDVDVLNAAVSSYSPLLYYLRTRYLLETVQLQFDELHVYIDISDLQDEIVYAKTVNRRTYLADRSQELLLDHSLLGRALVRQFGRGEFDPPESADYPWDHFYFERARWTFLKPVFESWGKDGFRLARHNMTRLDELCRAHGVRLAIAVYPWPEQLRANDAKSIQALLWQQFAEERGIELIDYFPDFMSYPELTLATMYIPDDIHWNPNGHRLVATKWLQQFCSRQGFASCRG